MTATLSDADALGLALMVAGGGFVCCIALVALFWLASIVETARKTRRYIRIVNTFHTRSTQAVRTDEAVINHRRRIRHG